MNVLILSNGAPNYYNFFNALCRKLTDDGYDVFYAVDCETSVDENHIRSTQRPFKTFSSYFANHETCPKILRKYSKYNLNFALFSDYERAVIYNIWGRRDNAFYEKLKSALLNYFEAIIYENEIDLVFYENVSNSFAYFCWFVCQELDVKYVGLTGSRLPGRFWITDDPLGESAKIQNTLENIESGKTKISPEVREWVFNYLNKIETIIPDYMNFNNLDNISLLDKYFKKEKAVKIYIAIKHIFDDHYHSYQRGNPILLSWNLFYRSLARRIKVVQLKKYFDSARKDESFILYPLHFHPESSTSILCGAYLNEFEVIQNIAFNLPQGLKLYVKDHMSAFGYPSIDFYRRITSLPNVRLLPSNAPTKKLIKASKAVITLTSTVGYEALMLDKPVYLFGSVFYENHKNVIKISDPTKLYEHLNNIPKMYGSDNKDYNARFVSAYYLSTLPGTLNFYLDSKRSAELVESIYLKIMEALKIS